MFALLVFFPQAWAAKNTFRVQVFSRFSLQEARLRAPSGVLRGSSAASDREVLSEDSVVRLSQEKKQIHWATPDRSGQGSQLWIESTPEGFLEVEGEGGVRRRFRGRLNIRPGSQGLQFFLDLSLEDYVQGVLASEIPADTPIEAMKAMAVLIRTYALASAPRHADQGFDFCDLTHCQAFGGFQESLPQVEVAARSTRCLILTYQDKPIQALYHSTCGGHTSANQNVFGGQALPYLQGVVDPYCKASPNYSWEAQVERGALEEIFRQESMGAWSGPLTALQAKEAEPQGRIFSLEAVGANRLELRTEKFLSLAGKKLGWNQVKSAWFTVLPEGDAFHFTGHGLGHGVGLCQWGARGMALEGKKFDQILRFYFPQTRLRRR